ncbi:lytic transglycosylase domain-containing protein [Natronosporangium hydrolyticum]|uniref:Lytic transglycosylase domain-containing protein n=1 Tax=Natronosporangium hydrolyticum TaxID=2811111 RepID=A0A895YNH5_9ACTN|nr:lytic transglycosylase domain-containing protein [Natronosporangium hydrolyticum]QSB15488.1 lytic transglycosylase domain-containing protein [Natronosporangium hydrolyticum]
MAALSPPSSQQRPKGHRRRDHIPRHVREEHRIARTAAAGAAGAVVIGAAFGITGGNVGGDDGTVVAAPASNLNTVLDQRAEYADDSVSRGLARAPLPPGAVGVTVPRAQAPEARQVPQAPASPSGPPATSLPDIPADCEEYSGNRAIGCALLSEFGFGLDQMPALDSLWTRESGWNHQAHNGGSGAYGIPQALPGNKMASAGSDWETNPATQIRWGLGYISDRYGSPDAAWAFFQNNGWY